MKVRFRFNVPYFIIAVLLFLIEVYIALYVDDAIVRPYVGGLLVVVLLYCFIRSFIDGNYLITGAVVLLIAYLIETLQYFRFIYFLGLEDNTFARMVLGIGFDWIDIVAYTIGVLVIIVVEYFRKRWLSVKNLG